MSDLPRNHLAGGHQNTSNASQFGTQNPSTPRLNSSPQPSTTSHAQQNPQHHQPPPKATTQSPLPSTRKPFRSADYPRLSQRPAKPPYPFGVCMHENCLRDFRPASGEAHHNTLRERLMLHIEEEHRDKLRICCVCSESKRDVNGVEEHMRYKKEGLCDGMTEALKKRERRKVQREKRQAEREAEKETFGRDDAASAGRKRKRSDKTD